jgi:diaminopimelate decarboxylase
VDHFTYRDGELFAEDVAVKQLAATFGTPLYIYSSATLERHYRVFSTALCDLEAMVCYAVKANGNVAVVATLARLGAGADVVSGGELQIALAAGVPADRIIFSGGGKTEEEMAAALRRGIRQINVESLPELQQLSRVALSLGRLAPAALRINPDVDAGTHDKIATGRKENKFGIEWTAANRIFGLAAQLPGIRLNGIAVHIGSQITRIEPFREAFQRVRDLVVMLRAEGHEVTTLDLGGGLGVPYSEDERMALPSPDIYGETVRASVGDLGCQLILEPGRLLVANAGILVTRVLYVKNGASRTFVIVDAGMNDLLRPALYDAFHAIVPVSAAPDNAPWQTVDIVGPICETSDTFAVSRPLPPLHAGDLLAIRTAGAYGAAMASTYNARPLPAEVLVSNGRFAVVSERQRIEDLLARQRLPDWLTATKVQPMPKVAS